MQISLHKWISISNHRAMLPFAPGSNLGHSEPRCRTRQWLPRLSRPQIGTWYRSTVELQEDVGNPFGWEYWHTVHRRLVPVITSCLVPHYPSKELIGWKNEVSRILTSRWCTGISDGISKYILWKSHDFPIFLNQAILPTMARDIAYSLGRAALPVLTAALFEATSHDYPKTII